MNLNFDYYTFMGLREDVFQPLIKKRFRELAKIHHPDKGGDGVTFSKVKEGYDILGDPKKRLRYDDLRGNYTLQTHLPVEIFIKPEQILTISPVDVEYRRKIECDCGIVPDCEHCWGSGIKEEAIEMTFRETNLYPDGLTFTVADAGSVDKYGRQQDAIVKMIYRVGGPWEYNKNTHKFTYTVTYNLEQIETQFKDKGYLEVYINEVGTYRLTEDSFLEGSNIAETTHPRLRIRISILLTDIKSLLEKLKA